MAVSPGKKLSSLGCAEWERRRLHRPSQAFLNYCSKDALLLSTPTLRLAELLHEGDALRRLQASAWTPSKVRAAAGLSLRQLEVCRLSAPHPDTCSRWRRGDRSISAVPSGRLPLGKLAPASTRRAWESGRWDAGCRDPTALAGTARVSWHRDPALAIPCQPQLQLPNRSLLICPVPCKHARRGGRRCLMEVHPVSQRKEEDAGA